MRQSVSVSPLENSLLLMRLITGAMIAGVLAFGVIASIVKKNQPVEQPVLTYVALVMALTCLGTRLLLPDMVARNQLKDLDLSGTELDEAASARMAAAFQIRLIVGLALCEGPAFFNLVAWWLEGQTLAIATVGFLLLVMVSSLPSRRRLEYWIERQIESSP